MKRIIFTCIISLWAGCFAAAQNRGNSENFDPAMIASQRELMKLRMAYLAITQLYVDETENSKVTEDAIKAMLEKLDPHSSYTNAEETRRMNEPLEANFDGIGIQFDMLNDTLYIVQVISGGPSEKVGLLAGDRIILVNDSLIAGVRMSNTGIRNLIRGKKGTEVHIKVKRGSMAELLEFKIIRDKIPVNSIDASYMADAKTGYIRLSRFAATSLQEFEECVSDLKKKGMKHLILDLQDNGGGYLHIAQVFADQFLEKGRLIYYTQGNRMRRTNVQSTEKGLFMDGKLVILVDESSASASEIVAGAVQDWDRGVIVGRRSFGKGLVQRAIDLPDSSMIRLTVARYYTPSGRNIQKPYEKGNINAYNRDWIDRYNRGELMSADSIHFPDSLKYKTLLSQRTVYGGGGIMPDIFVPIDSMRRTEYHIRLAGYRLLDRMVINYLDKNRNELKKNYPNIKQFKEKFHIPDSMLQDLIAMASTENIEFNEEQFNISKEMISFELKAYIASYLFQTSDYYEFINERSKTYQQALQIINDDELYHKILNGS